MKSKQTWEWVDFHYFLIDPPPPSHLPIVENAILSNEGLMQIDHNYSGKRRHDDDKNAEGCKAIKPRKKRFPNSSGYSKDSEPKPKKEKNPTFLHWTNKALE